MQSISRRSLLNYIGIAILIAGMGTGEFIYWRSLRHDSAADDGNSPYDSRVYEQTMERTIGIFGVIMDQWERTVAKLEEPGPLGITIAVVSMLAAGGCFAVAARMPRE
jgi:disulfide bond formation protein DsbB